MLPTKSIETHLIQETLYDPVAILLKVLQSH